MRNHLIPILLWSIATIQAEDGVRSVVLEKETPTLHALGYVWTVSGDQNGNASVSVAFRETGADAWRNAMPLRRIEIEAMVERRPAPDHSVFAGSILSLEPNTEYEVKLVLSDPDGGTVTEQFRERTRGEPVLPKPQRTLHAIPGDGGGSGTPAAPFRGLTVALKAAEAGDVVLLGRGTYTLAATAMVANSGTADAPIVFRGETDANSGLSGGLTIIEGPEGKVAIGCYRKSHIVFERLVVRKASIAFQLNASTGITIRRCRIENVNNGIFGDAGKSGFFIADNEMIGNEPFPRPAGWKTAGEPRGVQLSGSGHVVCYNQIRNFRDGIDVRGPAPVRGIDFHNNEISEMTDDGIELDNSDHNTRAYLNRITNTQTGISFQPIRGGPAYAVRNVLMNVLGETFKLKLSPTNPKETWETGPHRTSGGVLLHNTVVKNGPPLRVWSSEGPVHHYLFRNNVLIGVHANAIDISPPMRHSDLDYNAYVAGGKAFTLFAYWNKTKYPTLAAFAAATGQEQHGLQLDTPAGIFAANLRMPTEMAVSDPLDARLAPRSPLIDRGEPLPGINDGYAGRAPDLGAIEAGETLPHYGPRPIAGPRQQR